VSFSFFWGHGVDLRELFCEVVGEARLFFVVVVLDGVFIFDHGFMLSVCGDGGFRCSLRFARQEPPTPGQEFRVWNVCVDAPFMPGLARQGFDSPRLRPFLDPVVPSHL